jgi:choline dehydrogenase-like flavoprotein
VDPRFDILIVGSGPAGVSAAFPLLDAGLRVAMMDGGHFPQLAPPERNFLAARQQDGEQWRWMLGRDFHALRLREAVSPKLRAPTLAYAFDGFAAGNRVRGDDFIAVGSLASGGLSNAWGCGVARLTDAEGGFPFPAAELDASYELLARRIGISGACEDDLSGYFGLDPVAEPPLPLDRASERLLSQYQGVRDTLHRDGFRMGRSRVAVLSRDRADRKACNLSANCLFGCHRGAMYSAAQDLATLRARPNFTWLPGSVVSHVAPEGEGWAVHATEPGGASVQITVPRVVLAAGTLATTALVLRALRQPRRVRLLSGPTAAFLLWQPALLGQARADGFGLGQLSFTVDLPEGGRAFGSTFATTGLPLAEFARHLPLARRGGMQLLRHLLSSCLVGNVFLPGHLSQAEARLDDDGELVVSGGHAEAVAPLLAHTRSVLARSWRRMGAWLLPGSFTAGRPGSDIHYAGTLPMARDPAPGQTSADGAVQGLPGLYVVDGACLPALPEKSHTLTLMANADRIGRKLARSRA